ncbi:MAG: ARMT1-like domain-containing protein [Bacillota bacterium]
MQTQEECYGCLDRLITTTVRLASADSGDREKSLAAARAVLREGFSRNNIPTQIAAAAQRVIREICGDSDPFKEVKKREQTLASEAVIEAKRRLGDDWEGLFRLAALGNTVDFFRDLESVAEQMKNPVDFTVNQIPAFLERLKKAKLLLFLADNAAECYFDLPLFRKLFTEVDEAVYVVKERPVQNDLTILDLTESGLKDQFKRVETTGTDSPGIDLESASSLFRELYDRADLIVAKGMGYYETFSETGDNRVFYLLKAKCDPVALSIGVPKESFVSAFNSNHGGAAHADVAAQRKMKI